MAELVESSEISRCYCCLAKNEEKRLQVHNVQSHVMKMVLQMDNLVLCYICKKIAEKSEQFINNVHNFQNLFHHFMDTTLSIESIINKNNAVIELTTLQVTPDDVIYLSGKNEDYGEGKLWKHVKQEKDDYGEPSHWIEIQNASLPEPQEEEYVEKPDSETESSSDSNDGYVDPFERIQTNILKGIKVQLITITREQCMEERRRKAAEERFSKAAFRCEDCVKVFALKDTYESHMLLHQECSGLFECDICKRRMPSKVQMTIHQKYHTNRYKCSKCNYLRKSNYVVREHYMKAHCDGAYGYSCQQCGEQYRSKGSLHNHIASKHKPEVAHKCNYCDKKYASNNSLKGHILRVHAQEQNIKARYVCNVCRSAFTTQHQLAYHSAKHSDKRDFFCVECNKSFKTKESLRYHYNNARAHINENSLVLQCDHCEKRFNKRRMLTQHMNLHLNIRPFKCSLCDRAFVTKIHLKIHVKRVHGGFRAPKNHECTICNKFFDGKHTLESHIRTHTGEKPFKCKQCPAQFSHSGTLYNHVKLVHLGLTRDGRPKVGKKRKYSEYVEASTVNTMTG